MKKRNWRFPQKAKSPYNGSDAWWYGDPNSISVVIEIRLPGGNVSSQCKIMRRDIELWLKEVKPKRKKR